MTLSYYTNISYVDVVFHILNEFDTSEGYSKLLLRKIATYSRLDSYECFTTNF